MGSGMAQLNFPAPPTMLAQSLTAEEKEERRFFQNAMMTDISKGTTKC